MLSVILFFAFFGFGQHRGPVQHEAPGAAATTPNPDYPLKLRVLSSYRTNTRFAVHGYGAGNLLGPPAEGFDYSFDCERGFLHNAEKDDFYQGKWKKPNQKIEILIQEIGTNHVEKCDLNVTLKSAPYGKDNPPPPPLRN